MSSTGQKRKRARYACLPCHQRKRKCDGEYPCSLCTKYDYFCRYVDHNRSQDTAVVQSIVPPSGHRLSTFAIGPDYVSSLAAESGSAPPARQEPREADGADSTTIAFPHILGQALDGDKRSDNVPLANNFGTRTEGVVITHEPLSSIISEASLNFFSAVYFQTMGLIGDFLDQQAYTVRCQNLFNSPTSSQVMFSAVAAGIAALGSFLSPQKFARENELIQYAKAIIEDPACIDKTDVEHLIAWALRVLYIRATTRPVHAWLASCTLMHLCEAAGLHNEKTIQKMSSVPEYAARGDTADTLRRVFWIAWAGNNLMSYDYNRSPVIFRAVTTTAIAPTRKSLADQFVRIAQIVPTSNSPFQFDRTPANLQEDFSQRLMALAKLEVADPFLLVTKACLALCFYRRLYELKTGVPDECIRTVIDTGNAAVYAAEQLAKRGLFFWNVIGSVFQYACVLLSMDMSVSSTHIGAALQCLDYMAKASDTKATRDARDMIHRLLDMSIAKKKKELSRLESVRAVHETDQRQSHVQDTPLTPDFDGDFDWDQFFLEPSMFAWLGGDAQLT